MSRVPGWFLSIHGNGNQIHGVCTSERNPLHSCQRRADADALVPWHLNSMRSHVVPSAIIQQVEELYRTLLPADRGQQANRTSTFVPKAGHQGFPVPAVEVECSAPCNLSEDRDICQQEWFSVSASLDNRKPESLRIRCLQQGRTMPVGMVQIGIGCVF